MNEGGVAIQRVSSLTPAVLLRVRPRKDFDEASFETNPARIRVAYAALRPLRTLSLDELGSLVLEVRNLGSRTWRADGEFPLRFGYHWSDPDRTGSWQSVVWDDGSRLPLGRNVRRGESAEIVLRVKPPQSAGPTWRLVVAPVLEGLPTGWAVEESQTYVSIVDVRGGPSKP